jgi:hypothetical protein
MSDYPPYMNAYGSIGKVLDKMIEARRPERFTQDYLETVLALPGSSLRPAISLLKRIGFLNSDGTPTELYSKFKTDGGRKGAMAAGLKIGYPEIFKRNEYANKLDKSKLTDIIVEMTGLEKNHGTVRNIVGTFGALNAYADFDQVARESDNSQKLKDDAIETPTPPLPAVRPERVGMNLSYTINLNLPETTNIEVFNSIFRALKANMLQ